MKVVHWNTSKKGQQMSGVKNYEDNLFENLKNIDGNLEIERIQRSESAIFGSMPLSWLFRYKCKDADIVHATFHMVAPAKLFRKTNTFLVTVHDIAPFLYPSVLDDISLKLQWKLTPYSLKKADKIIAISNFTKNELIRLLKIREEKIDVVHYGINHEIFKPLDKYENRKKLGLDEDGYYILTTVTEHKRKRVDLVKKLARRLHEKNSDIRIIKTGEGYGKEYDNILGLGYIENNQMPILYNAADIYYHPAEYEGFGLPVLEAMACGTPVIANDVASIPEIVKEKRYLINLEEEDYFDILEDKIEKFLDIKRDETLINISKKFTWEKAAEETFKVYDTLMVDR